MKLKNSRITSDTGQLIMQPPSKTA